MKTPSICIMTSVHRHDDVRIYHMGGALMFEDAEYMEYMIQREKGGIP